MGPTPQILTLQGRWLAASETEGKGLGVNLKRITLSPPRHRFAVPLPVSGRISV